MKGKVAAILTSRELVINRGSDDGVIPGMRFVVLDPRTQDIPDPETGKSLGSIPLPKVRVEVTRTTDRLALARTYEVASEGRRGSPLGGVGSIAALLGGSFDQPATYVSLRKSPNRDELDPSESYVNVGDPVEEIAAEAAEVAEDEGAAAES